MKLIFAFPVIWFVVTLTDAGVPLPQPGDSQDHLTKNCQIPKCPVMKDQEKPLTLPYPMDCLQYVECKGSETRVLACPPDEVFDKETSSCGPREKVHCVPCYQQAP
ncbi:uncharacterized protein LOC108625605 [Ceratina calcarata]|uniref:Uncharacterized protein LOC108625605 n=1 Tax=Ceratina calcarata TaxID=156304 RepID=A0AAJ7N7B4_9HYME|nr:uncharacterized protein LOC108625605 [Ceratina calcarata]